jgi:hypothetical protein
MRKLPGSVVRPISDTSMIRAECIVRVRRRFERLFDALTNPSCGEWTMLVALGGYLTVWSLYAAISKSSADIHLDMGEMVAWSREVGIGTPKHPPLGAWLVRLWFAVAPREDWSYYVLAAILPTVALWITWRISAVYLPRDKRVVGIALLTLVPFYNFHALKFNANSVLTPFWAATIWWFLRSFETRYAGWAVLAGSGAAAAMLGKYWSIILLVGLGITALVDRRRDLYFGTPAPYLTLAAATILFTPHFDWLIANGFVSFNYALDLHPATLPQAAISLVRFMGSSIGYVAAPLVLCLLVARPTWAAIADTLWPEEPRRRALVMAFGAPFLVAVLLAVLVPVQLEPLWAMPMMTLFPLFLLSSPLVTIPRPAAAGLLALAIIFPLIMLAISPAVAILTHWKGLPNNQSNYRLLARAVEAAWRRQTDEPLRIVAGGNDLENGMVFYFTEQPSTFDLHAPAQTPWVDDARIRRDGMAMICPQPKWVCLQIMAGFAARYHGGAPETDVVSRRYFGIQNAPQTFEITIIVPQAP